VCENVLYFINDNPAWVIGAGQTQLNNIVGTAVHDHVLGVLSSSIELIRVQTRDMRLLFGSTLQDFSHNGAGLSGPLSSTANVAVNVALLPLGAPYSRRGRIYQPGVVQDQIVNNRVSSGLAASLAAAWSTILTLQIPDQWHLVVAQQWQGGWLPEAIPWTVTDILVTNPIVAPRRKRLSNPFV
jgi:hypothetical protein